MEDLQEDGCVIEKIKGLLPKFNQEKKMTIMRQFIRITEGFDYRVLYNMCLKELSTDSEKDTATVNSSSEVLDSEPIMGKGDVFGIKQLHKSTLLRIKLPTVSSIPFSCHENNFIVPKSQKPFCQNHVFIGVRRPRFDDGDAVHDGDDDHREKPILVKKRKIKNYSNGCGLIQRKVDAAFNIPDMPEVLKQLDDDDGANGDDDHRENPIIAKKRKTKNYSNGCGLIKRKVDAAFNIPDIPEVLKQLVDTKKGSNPVFVVQKQLFGSDVDPNKGRLALPLSQLSSEFLTEDEKDYLSKDIRVEGKKPRIPARIFEPCGEEREIYIAKWNMGSVVYSLITSWNQVVKTNSLRDGMQIQLWSFRIDTQLCFLLLK